MDECGPDDNYEHGFIMFEVWPYGLERVFFVFPSFPYFLIERMFRVFNVKVPVMCLDNVITYLESGRLV